ncbi:MAG: cyclic nucleotide-binding domain-containing protein [Chloroflexi bacterium]|nr:cyclic nucleotide-binding domain-containing protein [Chloroflexota bacterium]
MQPQTDLSAIPLFADLPKEELAQLNALAHRISYQQGDVLFRQGEDATSARSASGTPFGVFVVLSGDVELRQGLPDGTEQTFTKIGPGGVFGLTSVLDEGPRRASGYAVTDGSCLVLSRITFHQALMSNPSIAINMMKSMARHIRELSALLAQEAQE